MSSHTFSISPAFHLDLIQLLQTKLFLQKVITTPYIFLFKNIFWQSSILLKHLHSSLSKIYPPLSNCLYYNQILVYRPFFYLYLSLVIHCLLFNAQTCDIITVKDYIFFSSIDTIIRYTQIPFDNSIDYISLRFPFRISL